MKKRVIQSSVLLIVTLTAMILLTACGVVRLPPNEERVNIDVAESLSTIIPENRNIDQIEITETETDLEAGVHEVIVKVNSNDGKDAYLSYYRLVYLRNEEKLWDLLSFKDARDDEWTKKPIIGVDESQFKPDLMGTHLKIRSEDWVVDEQSLDSFTIVSRDTELEQGKDTVVIDVVLSSGLLVAEGQLTLEYLYQDRWISPWTTVSVPFTVEINPDTMLEMTDDKALDVLVELRQFDFSSGNTLQSIQLNREQISNVNLVNTKTEDKGTLNTYEHTFTLEKELVTFEIKLNTTYRYDATNGWLLENTQLTSKVTKVKLDGTTWGGIYTHRYNFRLGGNHSKQRVFTLTMTEFPTIGGLRATLTELSTPVYSQTLFGRAVDLETLTFDLAFEEWVDAPTWSSAASSSYAIRDSQVTFKCRLDVENSKIVDISDGLWSSSENVFDTMILQDATPEEANGDEQNVDEQNGGEQNSEEANGGDE